MNTKVKIRNGLYISITLITLYLILSPSNILKIKNDVYYYLFLIPALCVLANVLYINSKEQCNEKNIKK